MGIVSKIRSAFGSDAASSDQEEPSHRCRSCGEEYYTNPNVEITSCRSCGGTKVDAVA